MSSAIEFILRLVNQASGPAKQAAGDLDGVSRALVDMGKSSAQTDKATRSVEDLSRELRKVQLEELKAQRGGASNEVLKTISEKRKTLQLDRDILKLEKQIADEQKAQTGAQGEATQATGESALKMGALAGIAQEVTSRIIDGARAAANMAMQFGKATVEAAAFKSDMVGGLEALMGNREDAKGLAAELLGFKGADSFDPKAIASAGKALTGAGFASDEIMILVRSMADLAAFGGGDGAFTSVADAIAKARGTGKFNLSTLQSIASSSGYAFTPEQVIEELGRTLGKSNDEVGKLLSQQGIELDEGLGALVRTIRDGIGGGQVGGYAAKGADTIPGLLAQLRSKFFNLVPAVEDSPGLMRLQGLLQEIVKLLDEANPLGQRLKKAFDGLVNRSFTAIFGKVDPRGAVEKIVSGFETLSKVVPAVLGAIRGFGEGFLKGAAPVLERYLGPLEDLGDSEDGVLKIAEAGEKLGEVLGWVYDKMNKLLTGGGPGGLLATAGKEIGENFIRGLFDGIEASFAEKFPRISKLFGMLPKAAESELEIRSPSRRMARVGEHTIEGFMLPIDRAANDVHASMAELVSPPDAPRLSAMTGGSMGGGGWGGTFSPSIVVNVEAGGATKDDAEAIGEQVGEAVRIELVRFLEEAGLAAGVA